MDWLFLIIGIVMVIVKVNHILIIPDFLIWISFGVAVVSFICQMIQVHKVKNNFKRW